MTKTAEEKRALRKIMRRRRAALGKQEQRAAAYGLAARLGTLRAFRNARRIAFYAAADGEIDPRPARELAASWGRRCYLPVLYPARRRLVFFADAGARRWTVNSFGIAEPRVPAGRMLRPAELDLILVPLVAFDGDGRRVGMGGGFYDGSLHYLRHRRRYRRPVLVGVAHDFQKVDKINGDPWDIPLDAVVTDRGCYRRR